MIGLFLLYFIGKSFYDLAGKYKKSQWGFAILGVVSYYAGQFIGGIIIGIFYELVLEKSIDSINDILLSVFVLPFGVLSCWGLYKILEKQWAKAPVIVDSSDVLDAGFINQQEDQNRMIE